MNDAQKNRLFELLTDETLFSLSGEELMELNRLKTQFPEWENDFSAELTAAAIGLSNLGAAEILPANLRAKVLADADNYFSRSSLSSTDDARQSTGGTSENVVRIETVKPSFFGQWLGWAVAAAACLALAINLWLTYQRPQTEIAKNQEVVKTPEPVQKVTTALSPARQREQLIADAPDVVKIDLKPADAKTLTDLSGDVVWSNSQQKGFVRFRNLPANDAAKETYQLWIVDAARNEKTPVSGGVFDVSETGEIIVPVNAQLEIKNPKAFAVTREKPGGVVVSSPQRVIANGKV